jgi:hypothetical protein
LNTEAVACWGMIVAFISKKTGQFTYFSMQLGDSDWSRKNVLDFGGNIGNMLRDPNSTIDERRYWCLDVNSDAIDAGRASHPNAHWHFYNRNCFFFNPVGIPRLKVPRISQKFDFIVAYSVFTNMPRSDMLEIVPDLQRMLHPAGVVAFTFIDPHYRSWPDDYHGDNLLWRLERERSLHPDVELDIERLTRSARDARWFILVNGTDLYIECDDLPFYRADQQRTCHVFYTEEYMKTLFPDARVLPPVNGEMQHCCIISR